MLATNIKKALQWSAFFIYTISNSVCWGELIDVAHVIDGDTVILESGKRVRLIGINAPEKESENRVAEPYALEAKLALRELVEGVKVEMILGEDKFDRYGRTLAYLKLQDGSDVQEEMIAKGYAALVAFPPNIKNIKRYVIAEKRARSKRLGIWGNEQTVVRLDQPSSKIDTGFRIIRGRVTEVKQSKRNKHLLVENRLTVLISHNAWKAFWGDESLSSFVDEEIEARGWITERGGNKWLVVRHPSMITFK